LKSFDYLAPGTIKEAVAALNARPEAMVLAGGTDTLVRMKTRVWAPEMLVDIKRIPGIADLTYDRKTGLTIGAAVTMRQVELSETVQKHYPAIAQGAQVVASVQVRNRATLVGNLCNAAPSADTAPGMIVTGAKVRIAGPKGRRSVLLEKFFTGPGQTVLKPGEMVTAAQVPPPGPRTGSAYARHTPRGAMDIAVVGVGVGVTLAPRTGACEEIKIVLGAVASTPLRVRKAEKVLKGQAPTPELIDQAAEMAAEEARPIDDVRASAGYRRDLVRVLTRRMIAAALEDARKGAQAKRRTA